MYQKIFLFLIFLISSNTVFSQWEKKEYVDEFGDPTGEIYEAFIAQGTFSNSATQNSKAAYAFIKDDSSLTIKVYEYNKNLATSIENTFETVKIKKPNKEVTVIDNVFFTKSGSLFFNEEEFKEVIEAIKESGDYTMIFDRTTNYSKSSYIVKFTIK